MLTYGQSDLRSEIQFKLKKKKKSACEMGVIWGFNVL